MKQNSSSQFLWKKYKQADIVSHLIVTDGESEEWRWSGWVKSAVWVHNWQMHFWKWTGKHKMQRFCQSAARKLHSCLSSKRCWATKLLFLNTAPCAEVLNRFIYLTQTWLESVRRKVPASCSSPAEETGSRQGWWREGWKQQLDSARSFDGNKWIRKRDVIFLVDLNISDYKEDTNVIKVLLSSE